MISTPYHKRLPETASWLFLLLYGVWAIFVLFIATLIALGLVWSLPEKDSNQDVILIYLFLLFVSMAGYGGYALYRAWRLAKNRQNLPKIQQEIAIMPIPPRKLPQNSFLWQTFWARPQIQIWQEKIQNIKNKKLIIISLLIILTLLLIYDYISPYAVFFMFYFAPTLYGSWQNKAIRLHYDHLRNILILEQMDSERNWQQHEFHLHNQIGVCTVWQPETHFYCVKLINQQFEATQLISHRSPLEPLTQKIAQATGLPILQENPLKAIT